MDKKQRIKQVKDAIAINSVDGLPPSSDCRQLLKQYIDGQLTVDQCVEVYIKKVNSK